MFSRFENTELELQQNMEIMTAVKTPKLRPTLTSLVLVGWSFQYLLYQKSHS